MKQRKISLYDEVKTDAQKAEQWLVQWTAINAQLERKRTRRHYYLYYRNEKRSCGVRADTEQEC
jgi:hypothetical protein